VPYVSAITALFRPGSRLGVSVTGHSGDTRRACAAPASRSAASGAQRRVAALGIVALAIAWCGMAGAGGDARLVIEGAVHDFGVVRQGAFVHHDFWFRNAGEGDLRLGGVRAPCGCIVTAGAGAVVPPGGEGAVEVSFDTARFQGRKAKTVLVSTNDPAHPVRELTLTGNVVPEVIVDPPLLYVGRIRPGAGATGEIRILSATGGSLEVVDAATDNPAFEAAVEPPADGGGGGSRVVIRVPPEMPYGRFSDTVRITARSPNSQQLEVPIFGSVEGDLLVEPPQVNFGSPARGRPVARELRVLNSGSGPISISGVRMADLPLDYTVNTVRAGYEYRIVLRLKRPASGFGRHGGLHIYTTHPEEQDLVVPLYATLNRRAYARP